MTWFFPIATVVFLYFAIAAAIHFGIKFYWDYTHYESTSDDREKVGIISYTWIFSIPIITAVVLFNLLIVSPIKRGLPKVSKIIVTRTYVRFMDDYLYDERILNYLKSLSRDDLVDIILERNRGAEVSKALINFAETIGYKNKGNYLVKVLFNGKSGKKLKQEAVE